MIWRDGDFSTLFHSCGFAWEKRVPTTFPGPGYLHSQERVVWLWHSLVNYYIWLTILSWYGSIPLALELIGSDGGFRTLCHSYDFACQKKVLKTFSGLGYLHSEDGVVWPWHSFLCLYIWFTRDGGFSTLCHSWGLACQERMLKTFTALAISPPRMKVIWQWYSLLSLYIFLTI